MGSWFVRRMYWRAIWLLGIHSLGLWMQPDAADRDVRQDGLRKSSYDTPRRE
jgi:hypothetical protein